MASTVIQKEKIPLMTLLLWMTVKRATDIFHFFDEFDTPAEHAGWIAVLIAIVWTGVATAVIYWLYLTFQGKSLPEALEMYLGRYPGKAASALFAWFFLHHAALTTRSLTDTLSAVILPRTPPVLTTSMLLFAVVFAVRGGIEVVARSTIPIGIGMFAATGLITVLIAGDLQFKRLLPLLGSEPALLLPSSLYHAALSAHLPLFLMFLGATEPSRKTGWMLQAKNVFVHLFIAFTFALVTATMSWTVSHNKTFEFLSLVRYISVGEFIERIEPLLLPGWVTTAYASIAAHLLAALMATQSILGLKDYRPLSFPFGVLTVIVSRILFTNVQERASFVGYGGAGAPYNVLFTFALPLLLLPIFMLRRRALESRRRANGAPGDEAHGNGAHGGDAEARA